jgi:hypothetical protein
MYVVGLTGLKPIIGAVQTSSIAAISGLRADEEIIAINSDNTATWTMVADALITGVVDDAVVNIRLRSGTAEREVAMDLQSISMDELAEKDLLERIGITPQAIDLAARHWRGAARAGRRTRGITGW